MTRWPSAGRFLAAEAAANPERWRRTVVDIEDLAVRIELALQGPRHMWPPPDDEEEG
jgi:hypothetical protein